MHALRFLLLAVVGLGLDALAQQSTLKPESATLAPVNPISATEAASLASRRPASLVEVLKLAAKNNTDLKAARAQAAQVAAKAGLVYSALLPELTLSTSYVHTSVEQKFDTKSLQEGIAQGLAGAIEAVGPAYGLPAQANPAVVGAFRDAIVAQAGDPVVIVARNSLYGSLLMQQVLFSPQFFLLPAAQEAVDAARYGSLEAREQVLLAVARVYLGLEGLAQIEKAAKDAEAVALRRERDAKAQASAGMTTEINVLRAQTETAQARATIATVSGQRVALLALLEALAGEPVRPLDDAPTHFEVTASDEASQPWEAQWAIKANQMGVASQERFNFVDRLTWMPSLVGQLKGSYNSNAGFAGTNWIFDGIVALQWPLYDRGVRYANLHENDAKTAQLRAQLDGTRAKARANWVSAKTNVEAAEYALQQAESQAQLAGRAQKQIESAFQSGMVTSLEVSDIDSKRFFADSAAAQSRAQLEIRRVELAAAEGRLAKMLGLSETEGDEAVVQGIETMGMGRAR
ncbi:MAG: TolC family protein [Archangium sp.]|nr:TolC family protein [Archangium sp.]